MTIRIIFKKTVIRKGETENFIYSYCECKILWPFGKLPVSQKVKIGLAYELKCP